MEPESDDSEDGSESGDPGKVKSLKSVLRCPQLSALSRKRKVRTNPPTGRKRSCSRGISHPKSVTPAQRVKEHPGEDLSVSNGKLFSVACREELNLKANVVKNHQKSDKHKQAKLKLTGKGSWEHNIAIALQNHNKTNHPEGETLPVEQQVYQVTVLTAFLRAGIPLNKLPCFRQLLESSGL